VHFEDLAKFLNSDHDPIKIFFIMGSRRRILRDGMHPEIDKILNMQVPVVGICYGFQYMAMRSGGVLEDGKTKIKTSCNVCGLFCLTEQTLSHQNQTKKTLAK
jgi:GMP synthase-like glutamine amidotransferase